MQDVLKDLAGMCDNQQGSRHVQELLIRATPEEVSPINPTESPSICSFAQILYKLLSCSLTMAPASVLALHPMLLVLQWYPQ